VEILNDLCYPSRVVHYSLFRRYIIIKKKAQKLPTDIQPFRWTALLLLAFATLLTYIFSDILSPVKSLLETSRDWDSGVFGTYAGSAPFLNIFFFIMIFSGVILDKMGVRFTAILSGLIMIVGAVINWYALTEFFPGTNLEHWLNNNLNYIPVFDELGVSPFYLGMPASAKLASAGFMIFGCGVEMSGITIARGVVKWFRGKELALAMGLNMAIGRLGVATCMIFSPLIAKAYIMGSADVSNSIAFGIIMLMLALVVFIVYSFWDKKMDTQGSDAQGKDDPFRIRDIGKILTNSGFWLIALLCVLYYSAIIPFQKYAVNMLECNLHFSVVLADSFWASGTAMTVQYFAMIATAACALSSNFCKKKLKISLVACSVILLVAVCFMSYKQQSAGAIFSVFPLLAMCITPILGYYVDRKGKAATMLMLGSILLIACHLVFAFLLPLSKGNGAGGFVIAYASILVLGASFSLIPASLWPSIPKLVGNNSLGTAYALIFWIQNVGLWLVPILIGKVLTVSNTDVTEKLRLGLITSDEASVMYDYTNPLIMLACFGVAAFILGFILKITDRKKKLGLELPNTK